MLSTLAAWQTSPAYVHIPKFECSGLLLSKVLLDDEGEKTLEDKKPESGSQARLKAIRNTCGS